MIQLIIFPNPLNATCDLQPDDSGILIRGVPVTHPSGALGQGFDIPLDTPNGHGASLTIIAKDKAPVLQHGVLVINDGGLHYPWTVPGQTAAFVADTFVLLDAVGTQLPQLVAFGEFIAQEDGK